MKPITQKEKMVRNPQIMDLIYAEWADRLPAREELEDPAHPEYANRRYLMISQVPFPVGESLETHITTGGLFASPVAACRQYGLINGIPRWLIDLEADSPESALTVMSVQVQWSLDRVPLSQLDLQPSWESLGFERVGIQELLES